MTARCSKSDKLSILTFTLSSYNSLTAALSQPNTCSGSLPSVAYVVRAGSSSVIDAMRSREFWEISKACVTST